ncbi:MAG: two-component system response regulator GlrR, partial [Deltaproteobacteria bacterium]|nr:two-component system response regulator GlrR [Deltaproteobacteria bacterium]
MTRILLLADDPSVIRDVGARLSAQGCSVESASTLDQAFARLAGERFDFVIVDRVEDGVSAA